MKTFFLNIRERGNTQAMIHPFAIVLTAAVWTYLKLFDAEMGCRSPKNHSPGHSV